MAVGGVVPTSEAALIPRQGEKIIRGVPAKGEAPKPNHPNVQELIDLMWDLQSGVLEEVKFQDGIPVHIRRVRENITLGKKGR